jgi:hypothetical protein
MQNEQNLAGILTGVIHSLQMAAFLPIFYLPKRPQKGSSYIFAETFRVGEQQKVVIANQFLKGS